MNEADTCRKFIVPRLQAAGWDTEPHSIAEQRTITDGDTSSRQFVRLTGYRDWSTIAAVEIAPHLPPIRLEKDRCP